MLSKAELNITTWRKCTNFKIIILQHEESVLTLKLSLQLLLWCPWQALWFQATVSFPNLLCSIRLEKLFCTHWLVSIDNQLIDNDFIIDAIHQRAIADNFTIFLFYKQIDVSFSCICPVIDDEFHHNIFKVNNVVTKCYDKTPGTNIS